MKYVPRDNQWSETLSEYAHRKRVSDNRLEVEKLRIQINWRQSAYEIKTSYESEVKK